jgi:mevalonate kinase
MLAVFFGEYACAHLDDTAIALAVERAGRIGETKGV